MPGIPTPTNALSFLWQKSLGRLIKREEFTPKGVIVLPRKGTLLLGVI
jgi:hypothetical protein